MTGCQWGISMIPALTATVSHLPGPAPSELPPSLPGLPPSLPQAPSLTAFLSGASNAAGPYLSRGPGSSCRVRDNVDAVSLSDRRAATQVLCHPGREGPRASVTAG